MNSKLSIPKVLKHQGQDLVCFSENIGSDTWVSAGGWTFKSPASGVNRIKSKNKSKALSGEICAPMPGQILKVLVKNGQHVEEGADLFIVEAMKMEHTLKAPCSGIITDLNFKAGDSVSGTDVILCVKTDINKEGK